MPPRHDSALPRLLARLQRGARALAQFRAWIVVSGIAVAMVLALVGVAAAGGFAPSPSRTSAAGQPGQPGQPGKSAGADPAAPASPEPGRSAGRAPSGPGAAHAQPARPHAAPGHRAAAHVRAGRTASAGPVRERALAAPCARRAGRPRTSATRSPPT